MNLEKFRAQVSAQGLARTNKWIVRVFAPRGMTSTGKAMSDILSKGGNKISLNLPIFDAVDKAVDTINDLNVKLGSFSVNYNPSLPTVGYSISNMGDRLEALNLFTDTVTIPARDIQELEYRDTGEATSIGYRHSHAANLNMTYYCSEDLREKKFFEEWQKLIYNKDSASSGYYKDYTSRIEVIKYNSSMSQETAKYRFFEAYPTNIGEIELNNNADELVKLNIAFKFRNYERIEE